MQSGPSRLPRWFSAIVPAFLCCVALGACTHAVYNRLDTLAAWYLQSLVSLDEDQRAELRSWLEETLQWHRDNELSRYAAFVREISARASDPQPREAFVNAAERVSGYWRDLVEQTAPQAVELLMSLSPAQAEELIVNLEERGRERSEKDRKLVANGRWKTERSRDMQRQFKRWTGTITRGQRETIEATAERLTPTYHDWQETQAQWRAMLRSTLLSSAPDKASTLQSLLRDPQRHWTPAYVQKNEANRELMIEMLVSLDKTLTSAQRRHLQGELEDLADQLEAMRGIDR